MDSWKSPLLPLRFYPLPLGGKRYPKLRSIASAASASPAQVKEVDPNPQPQHKSGEIKPKSYLSRSWSFQAVRRNRYRRSKVQQIFELVISNNCLKRYSRTYGYKNDVKGFWALYFLNKRSLSLKNLR